MTAAPADIAARLNLRRNARSWRGHCPACGYQGAFSLRAGRGDMPLLWCANGCDRGTLAAAISGRVGGFRAAPAPSDAERAAAVQRKHEAARRLWPGSVPAADTLADRYLILRGLPGLAASPALRFRADTPHPEGGKLPALVAEVTDAAGRFLAVHRTFLASDGGKAKVEPVKAALGPVWGGAIRLDPLAPELVVAEGIESAASAGRLLGLPAWAAISAGNLARGLALPAEVRAVMIAADADAAGEVAARTAALRWQAEGRKVRIARPKIAGQDFNDVLMMEAGNA